MALKSLLADQEISVLCSIGSQTSEPLWRSFETSSLPQDSEGQHVCRLS